MLLEDICTDPAAEDSYAIRIASNYGQTEVVRMLLDYPRADPNTGIVQMHRRADPTANDNDAIRMASRNGHIEVVKLLLRDKRVRSAFGRPIPIEYRAIWSAIIQSYDSFVQHAREIFRNNLNERERERNLNENIIEHLLERTNLIADYSFLIDQPLRVQIRNCIYDILNYNQRYADQRADRNAQERPDR